MPRQSFVSSNDNKLQQENLKLKEQIDLLKNALVNICEENRISAPPLLDML